MKCKSLALFVLFNCFTVAAWAHGGMTHVIGVVKAMTPAAITVETQDHKTVEVSLVQSTLYEHGQQAAAATDIHVGDRVVTRSRR